MIEIHLLFALSLLAANNLPQLTYIFLVLSRTVRSPTSQQLIISYALSDLHSPLTRFKGNQYTLPQS